MIQGIDFEQDFVTNLEMFMSKADKFIKKYYAGVSEENHVTEITSEVKKLAINADLKQLETDYLQYRERQDLMGDYYDSAW
jgi:phosphoenolpyruvate carboxylase